MRRFLLAVAFTAIAVPSMAEEKAPIVVFGRASCGTPAPCSNYSDPSSPASLALFSQANACVQSEFGLAYGKNHFREGMGLDFNKCLSSTPVEKMPGNLTALEPLCCLVQVGESMCQLQCKMLEKR